MGSICLLTSVFCSEDFQEEMLRSGSWFIFVYFHHGRRPLSLNPHNHVRVITANVTVEDIAVSIDKVMVMLKSKMLENLIHWTRFRTVEFRTLHRFIGTNFFMFSSMLK